MGPGGVREAGNDRGLGPKVPAEGDHTRTRIGSGDRRKNSGGVVRRPIIDVNNLEADARRALARCGYAGMEFGEGVLVVVDGDDNRQGDHDPVSVSTGAWQASRSTLIDVPWAGLSRKLTSVGVAGAALWWTFSFWLLSGYQPAWDSAAYIHFGQWWIEGNLTELAINWPGTLMRPYVYHAALGAIGNVIPGLLDSQWARPAIAALQVVTFAAASLRLAGTVAQFGQGLSQAVVTGLLCAPFAVLTNTEVLSESISLSIACLLVASACPTGPSRSGRIGNVAGVLACLAVLAMTRTAYLPASLGAAAGIALVLFTGVSLPGVGRRHYFCGMVMTGAGLVACVAVVAPQGWLMWHHDTLVPNDGALWGAGGGQLFWSQQMGKYATVVADCPGVSVAAAPYPAPFVDAAGATGIFSWYLTRPHVLVWHLFQALNWDFPTTYITTFNPLVTVPLNAVSLAVAVVGLWTVASVAPRLIIWLAREAPVLGVVLTAIVGFWLQTAFTAVETRFGIIPWSALSVAAAWGSARWWERLQSRIGSWLPALYAVVATGMLLIVSRVAVAGVPVFQQYGEAGCWGYRQLTSLGIQSTSHGIRYQLPFPRRISDRMRVKLILERPYAGSVNLHVDVSGGANGVMTIPHGRTNEREFIFHQDTFRNNSSLIVTITSDGVDPNLRLGAWRYAFRTTELQHPEFITEHRVFAGLPDALTGRMTNEWWPMVWIAGAEWEPSQGGLRWPF